MDLPGLQIPRLPNMPYMPLIREVLLFRFSLQQGVIETVSFQIELQQCIQTVL